MRLKREGKTLHHTFQKIKNRTIILEKECMEMHLNFNIKIELNNNDIIDNFFTT